MFSLWRQFRPGQENTEFSFEVPFSSRKGSLLQIALMPDSRREDLLWGHAPTPSSIEFFSFPPSLAQDAIAGEGQGISHELITLEVSSPHVPDLTLIDLPGITRVAVGNQPADIGRQVRSRSGRWSGAPDSSGLRAALGEWTSGGVRGVGRARWAPWAPSDLVGVRWRRSGEREANRQNRKSILRVWD